MSVLPTYWPIVAHDVNNGNGVIIVTLKSGVVLEGTLNVQLSKSGEALHLHTLKYDEIDGGFHVIDLDEIAAMTGRKKVR